MGDMPRRVTLMRTMKTTVMARGSTVGQENRTEAMEEADTGTIIAAMKMRIMKRMKMMRTRKMREKKGGGETVRRVRGERSEMKRVEQEWEKRKMVLRSVVQIKKRVMTMPRVMMEMKMIVRMKMKMFYKGGDD